METRTWTVRYVAYSGDIVRTFVEADINATEDEVIGKAYEEEGIYSSNCIFKIVDVY